MTPLFDLGGRWHVVTRSDPRARDLADRHYSRQTPGAADFLGSGQTLCMLTDCARAVWGVLANLSPGGGLRWRVSIFRNEGAGLSSDLVREATARTYVYWVSHYGALPEVPLTTEVDPDRTRRKRDPGRCFRRAGWTYERTVRRHVKGGGRLVVLRAPEPHARASS